MDKFSSLTKKQKEAIGLLSLGTFLEYFDLMIYVHMAVLLNELFFPKSDPHTASLVAAAAFCSTYLFRPLGALLFGYIGDNIGRKPTVIITTIMMSLSCAVMAVLPTYAQIGIAASWAITVCRIFQGLSSMGEIIGAELYLAELIRPPARYPVTCIIIASANVGAIAALTLATAVFILKIDWRFVFWVGTLVALVGSVARTVLRETPEFADAKRRIKNKHEISNIDQKILKQDPVANQKVNQKTSLAYFLIRCSGPVWLYFVYIYCSGILKNTFHYLPEQIIQHNLILAIIEFFVIMVHAYLSYRICPFKIINFRTNIFCIIILLLPYLLLNMETAQHLLLIQAFLCMFKTTSMPATAICFTHFPVFKRFTYAGFLYAASRTVMYVVTSLGFVYLTEMFSYWGLLMIFIPIVIGFKFGISHFERLEYQVENDRQMIKSDPILEVG